MSYIKSIFDTDLYKFTVSYAYMKLYPHAVGTFKFTDRNNTCYTPEQYMAIQEAINDLSDVNYNNHIPMSWLSEHIPFIPEYYWEWLMNSFKFEPYKINPLYDPKTGHIDIEVTDAMHKATLYEIPLLCIVSAIQNKGHKFDMSLVEVRTKEKIHMAEEAGMVFSEFGTRRRFSYEVQEKVVELLKETKNCTGTSNVWLAYLYNMTPQGTHPHEWFMFHGAQFGYQHANYMALEAWSNVYDGDLGIALTDTYTTDAFFKDFSLKHTKLFNGLRQDSGDELEFTKKAINHYKNRRVDPKTKVIVYSNGLNFPKACNIHNHVKDHVIPRFGIGTNLTNDVGCKAPNIVMKLISCQMTPSGNKMGCIKLSDDLGKHLGNPKDIECAMHTLQLNK